MSDAGNTAINPDVEIRSAAQDRLDRAGFARRVAARIRDAAAGPSVVFGLAGPWGSGKSSVLNMISEVLTVEYVDTWAVVSFTPWSASDPLTLTEEFYQAIASAMPDTSAGRTARGLLTAAVPVGTAVGKAALFSVIDKVLGEGASKEMATAGTEALATQVGQTSFERQPDPFAARFTKISDAITEAGRNILVIVDDVDRLHADELLAVMKAVRLLGRFDRVHYLLSYDEQTLIDVLIETDIARGNDRRASRYLEKIVQYPFQLPPIQQLHLAAEFAGQLHEVMARHGLTTDPRAQDGSDSGIANCDSGIADSVFALLPTRRLTLRATNRLCNQLDMMLALVGAYEVDLLDAILMTWLRLEYRDLYAALPQWRRELTRAPELIRHDPNDVPKWIQRIADVVEASADATEIESVHRILMTLFPNLPQLTGFYSETRNAPRRVRDSTYFPRYFAFRLPIGDISDSQVRTELTVLTGTGRWPTPSLIRQCLADDNRRGLLRAKTIHHLDILADAQPQHTAHAAHLIAAMLPNGNRDLAFGGWSHVLYALLGHAISRTAHDRASQLATEFRVAFGLSTVVDVLAHPLELPTIDTDRVTAATEQIVREVIECCFLDLTTDLVSAGAAEHTVLGFAHFLTDEHWTLLQARIAPLLADGTTTLIDLAARFVSMSRATNPQTGETTPEYVFHRFNQDVFARLIPAADWSIEQVPDPGTETLDTIDISLANRRLYATIALRNLLADDSQ
ncbi:KAP family NTPase [Nocardia yamanashiensis]|uniref:KAP family P-loop NTPase fold protein n=1 Tax=Nocardia yamanashiensis TaxID=209247 RepID=UPI001E476158|nr:P-loop NTPase fold protein [Nocardia yamanashiensis]UGT43062.1 KAP family NTPase [Nocardia yamanashiensis]